MDGQFIPCLFQMETKLSVKLTWPEEWAKIRDYDIMQARLHRKTLCYSKSREMLKNFIRLVIHYLKFGDVPVPYPSYDFNRPQTRQTSNQNIPWPHLSYLNSATPVFFLINVLSVHQSYSQLPNVDDIHGQVSALDFFLLTMSS